MALQEIVKDALEYIGAWVEEDGDCLHLTVGVTDTEDSEGEFARTQLVSVYSSGEDEGEEIVVIFSQIGEYTDEVDLAAILRSLSSAVFSRVYIGDAEEDGREPLFVEAAAVLADLDASTLASMIQEVCDLTDELGGGAEADA